MQFFPALSPYLTGALLAIWLFFFLYGKRQYDQARKITMEMALSELKNARKHTPSLTVETYFEYLLPRWEAEIARQIKLIPHKSEFWPVPAKPDYVRTRLNFTPAWLGAYLKVNKQPLSACEELQVRIDEIAALSQKIALKSD
ncbi:MAG: hypothetical protein JW757_13270 [Anaerolineales bacterium]|nr:hypothetical protein [Anaerolineales bacterium]